MVADRARVEGLFWIIFCIPLHSAGRAVVGNREGHGCRESWSCEGVAGRKVFVCCDREMHRGYAAVLARRLHLQEGNDDLPTGCRFREAVRVSTMESRFRTTRP